MPYWQLFYHIVWATHKRELLLTPDVEPVIHEYLRNKAIGLEASVFALNGTFDHVHMVAAIPPKIAVAKFIGQIEAVASTKFNKSDLGVTSFFWQEEYGVFSFDGKRLPNYIAYVERQKQHHADCTTIPILERADGEGVQIIRELSTPYLFYVDDWRYELEALDTAPTRR
jgi:REP element-mobilizing transposase RayT